MNAVVRVLSAALRTLLVTEGGPAVFDALSADVMSRVTVSDDVFVYALRPGTEWQLVARSADGSGHATILAHAPAGMATMSPALSPDGRRLYFESNVRTPPIAGREDTDVGGHRATRERMGPSRPLGAPFASEYSEDVSVTFTRGPCPRFSSVARAWAAESSARGSPR